MNNSTNFWIPTTGEELQRLAEVLCDNQRAANELIKCHAWYGHFFDGHLGKVQANTSIIQGKPALLSDALVGICYQYGLVRSLTVTESTNERCTVVAQRNDEPADKRHTFTFTWQMAEQMGLVKGNWRKMPANMLKKRARSFICREVFPEAISGLYTIDEMADYSQLPETEIEELQARSIGFDDYSKTNSRPPEPQPMPPAQKKTEWIDIDADLSRVYREFDSEESFYMHCDELRIDLESVRSKAHSEQFNIASASPDERSRFFYDHIIHKVIRLNLMTSKHYTELEDEHRKSLMRGIIAEYPVLNDAPFEWIDKRLFIPAFAEALNVTKDAIDKDFSSIRKAFQSYEPNDWRLLDYITGLVEVDD